MDLRTVQLAMGGGFLIGMGARLVKAAFDRTTAITAQEEVWKEVTRDEVTTESAPVDRGRNRGRRSDVRNLRVQSPDPGEDSRDGRPRHERRRGAEEGGDLGGTGVASDSDDS